MRHSALRGVADDEGVFRPWRRTSSCPRIPPVTTGLEMRDTRSTFAYGIVPQHFAFADPLPATSSAAIAIICYRIALLIQLFRLTLLSFIIVSQHRLDQRPHTQVLLSSLECQACKWLSTWLPVCRRTVEVDWTPASPSERKGELRTRAIPKKMQCRMPQPPGSPYLRKLLCSTTVKPGSEQILTCVSALSTSASAYQTSILRVA